MNLYPLVRIVLHKGMEAAQELFQVMCGHFLFIQTCCSHHDICVPVILGDDIAQTVGELGHLEHEQNLEQIGIVIGKAVFIRVVIVEQLIGPFNVPNK